jgi:hypothetical protein
MQQWLPTCTLCWHEIMYCGLDPKVEAVRGPPARKLAQWPPAGAADRLVIIHDETWLCPGSVLGLRPVAGHSSIHLDAATFSKQ